MLIGHRFLGLAPWVAHACFVHLQDRIEKDAGDCSLLLRPQRHLSDLSQKGPEHVHDPLVRRLPR